MIRRVAQDPEPQRLLEEAVGGPWAGWQVAAAFANIEHHPVDLGAGHKGEEYNVSKSGRRNRKVASPVQRGMKDWRNTATVLELSGRMTVDATSGALLKSDLVVVFAARRPSDPEDSPIAPRSEPEAIVGTVESQTTLEQAGNTAPIPRPAAEDLAVRQRIVPEQKDLLSGLTPARGTGQDSVGVGVGVAGGGGSAPVEGKP